MDIKAYLARFATTAHIEEEIRLLRNNVQPGLCTLNDLLPLLRALHAKRQVLLGIV